MRKLFYSSAAAMIISAFVAAPAVGQQQPTQQQTARKAVDLNEVICEKQEETGSRLSSKRVCMTRSQWAEQRRLNRLDVDKSQMQRDLNHPQ